MYLRLKYVVKNVDIFVVKFHFHGHFTVIFIVFVFVQTLIQWRTGFINTITVVLFSISMNFLVWYDDFYYI